MNSKNWVYNKINYSLTNTLIKDYGLTYLASVVMQARPQLVGGDFSKLKGGAKCTLHNPFLFEDMASAVERIKTAVKNKEKITVFGDYDADGVTATALLCSYLESIGGEVDYYIPDRLTEGYGVNEEAIELIAERGTTLIITVDTGVNAIEEVYYASELGIDFIITDHHECKDELPECIAVINPKRPDTNYPFSGLSGVGVAFKLVCALCGNVSEALKNYSSLCAIGTIGDLMPVIDENRAIIKFGMKYFDNCPNYGVTAVLNECFNNTNVTDCTNISFYVVPRINAAGRVGTADNAIKMFMSKDLYTASNYAKMLTDSNVTRQKLCNDIYNSAVTEIETNGYNNDKIIVVAKKGWHKGVIGIAAAQVVRKYNKPAILLSVNDEEATGSARSTDNFNIYSVIESADEYLMRFGGHAQAAGLTINANDVDSFREKINSYLVESDEDFSKMPDLIIDYDMTEIPAINDVKGLERLKPFGEGNPSPVFALNNVKVKEVVTLKNGAHLKLQVEKNNTYIYALWFGKGKYAELINENDIVSIAGSVEINTFMGKSEIQMFICDLKKN